MIQHPLIKSQMVRDHFYHLSFTQHCVTPISENVFGENGGCTTQMNWIIVSGALNIATMMSATARLTRTVVQWWFHGFIGQDDQDNQGVPYQVGQNKNAESHRKNDACQRFWHRICLEDSSFPLWILYLNSSKWRVPSHAFSKLNFLSRSFRSNNLNYIQKKQSFFFLKVYKHFLVIFGWFSFEKWPHNWSLCENLMIFFGSKIPLVPSCSEITFPFQQQLYSNWLSFFQMSNFLSKRDFFKANTFYCNCQDNFHNPSFSYWKPTSNFKLSDNLTQSKKLFCKHFFFLIVQSFKILNFDWLKHSWKSAHDVWTSPKQ